MMTTFRILTWHYLKFAIWLLSGLAALMVLGPWLFAGLLQLKAGEPLPNLLSEHLYFTFIAIAGLLSLASAWTPATELFARSRMHVLPVSNRFAGTFLWLVPTGIIAALLMFTQLCYVELFAASWPILTTVTLVSITCLVSATVSAWLRRLKVWRLCVAAFVLIVWTYWLAAHFFPNGWQQPVQLWRTMSSADVLILLCTAAVCWWIMVDSFAHARHGEENFRNALEMLQKAPREFFDRSATATQSTAAMSSTALHQMHQQNARGIMLGINAGVFAVTAILLSLMALTPDSHHDSGSAIGLLVVLMMGGFMGGSIVGLLLGNEIRSKQGPMKAWYATLPFSDRVLCRSALRQTWRSSVQLWLTTVASTIIVLLILVVVQRVSDNQYLGAFLKNLTDSLSVYSVVVIAGFLSGLPATWAVCTLVATWSLLGRQTVQFSAIVTFFGLVVGMLILKEFGGPIGRQMANAAGILMVTATMLSTIGLFLKAVRRELLPSFTLPLAIGVLVITAFAAMAGTGQKPAAGLYLVLISLMMLPLATLPLAVVDGRHR